MTKKIEFLKRDLIDLYEKQKFSTYKIARKFNCDPSVIQKRMKEYAIIKRNPKKKIVIPREKMFDLYVRQNLSVSDSAKKLGISHCSVYYKLKEANIEPRKKKIFNISKKELEKLYLKDKLSCSKIAKIYGFNSVTVFEKLKKYSIKTRNYLESSIKYSKKVFDGGDELKAYMIGFRLGDLNVKSLSDKSTVVIKSSTTKDDQVDLIKNVYGKYGHFWIKKYGEVFSTMTFLDKSFNFLTKKEDNIEDWIMKNHDFFFAFLAGYVDAEGNMGVSQNRARFRIRTYDKNILLQIHEKLSELEINSKFGVVSKKGLYKTKKQNKDCYGVFVNSKDDLLRLLRLIKPYMKHGKRLKDLALAEKNILERNKKQTINHKS
ncbi:MAG: LAGLIDADG family homing endonuclease [Nanoarchaeota archaeon]